jgi:flavin reductase (DIM6/NTAB) family NADH-FMN oxidoreductase RutF
MKNKIALLMILLIPAFIFAQQKNEDRYLSGAVPEIDDRVTFQKDYDLPGVNTNTIYSRVYNRLEKLMLQNGNESRIVFSDKEEGQIVALGEEYLVFSSNAFSLDRALMSYYITATCSDEKCNIKIDRIKYFYNETRSSAEEQITDKIALNKKKTKIYPGYKKLRVSTIDLADNYFSEITQALGVESANQTNTETPPPVVQTDKATTISDNPESSSLQALGYKQMTADELPENIIKMLNSDWMLITAGDNEKFNMMTASWGGLGVLYGKPVALCFINPLRYTYRLMEKGETYTLSFYTEAYRSALEYCGYNSGKDTDKVKGSGLTPVTMPSGSKAFSEARLIIECKKLVGQSLNHDNLYDEKVKSEWSGKQLHKMYIGEIVNVWIK